MLCLLVPLVDAWVSSLETKTSVSRPLCLSGRDDNNQHTTISRRDIMSKMLLVALVGSSFGSALPGTADEGVGTLPPVEITATGDVRQVS